MITTDTAAAAPAPRESDPSSGKHSETWVPPGFMGFPEISWDIEDCVEIKTWDFSWGFYTG